MAQYTDPRMLAFGIFNGEDSLEGSAVSEAVPEDVEAGSMVLDGSAISYGGGGLFISPIVGKGIRMDAKGNLK